MSEREEQCEACGGNGCFDECVGHDPQGPIYDSFICRECNGVGWIAVEEEPLTLQDALMLDAQILRDKGVDVADPAFFELLSAYEPDPPAGRSALESDDG